MWGKKYRFGPGVEEEEWSPTANICLARVLSRQRAERMVAPVDEGPLVQRLVSADGSCWVGDGTPGWF